MKKINKKYFLENINHILIDNKISTISSTNINEFQIGKNYFYEVIDNYELLKIQKWLSNYILNNIEINNAATAFRKKYSYLHLFEPHRKNYHFLRLDIKSFFHSIRISDIEKIFKQYFTGEYIDKDEQQSLLSGFIDLVTYKIPTDSPNKQFQGKRVLPMGFITSPASSNIIFRRIDIQIQKICFEKNIIYTRYADDMLFSSEKGSTYLHSNNFVNEIRIIISQMGLRLNQNKTIKTKHTISLNGYTIQYSYYKDFFGLGEREEKIHEVRFSNKRLFIIKKMLHMINKEKRSPSEILKKLFKYKLNSNKFKYPTTNTGTLKKYYNDQLLNKIAGYRAYLLSIVQFNKKYQCTRDETIEKYSKMIEQLNSIIDTEN